LPVNIKNKGIRSRAAIQQNARHKANVPHSDGIQGARRQMEQHLVESQREDVAPDVDGQNDNQWLEQTTAGLIAYCKNNFSIWIG